MQFSCWLCFQLINKHRVFLYKESCSIWTVSADSEFPEQAEANITEARGLLKKHILKYRWAILEKKNPLSDSVVKHITKIILVEEFVFCCPVNLMNHASMWKVLETTNLTNIKEIVLNLEVRRLGFEFQFLYLIRYIPWVGYSIFLSQLCL